MKHRNVGIIGASDSGAKEVFDAILRFDQTPKPDYMSMATCDGLTEWESPKDYDAKKRKRLFEDKS